MASFLGPSLILLFCFCNGGMAVASGSFSAGVSREDITPDAGMVNWIGHKQYDGVLDSLSVGALVLADGTNKVAILCWDLLDASEAAVTRVRKAIAVSTEIPESNILVNGSHTHSAPWSPKYGSAMIKEEMTAVGPVEEDPVYQAWAGRLPEICARAAGRAATMLKPATLAIGRASVPEVLFNRRPRKPDGTVQTMFEPADAESLPDGLRFGPMDSTLTIVSIRDTQGGAIATLFHLPCHAVCIYPYHQGISADWPGSVAGQLRAALGGEAFFLQGCAGDIVPARRGLEARDKMARLITERALAAAKKSLALEPLQIQTGSASLGLPLTDKARQELGAGTIETEVQVIRLGPLALVALPGEPLIDLASAIQRQSPFPHTLVLGYSNGLGVRYVGMPGEKKRGGYEMGPAGIGADECGLYLVETALRLLEEQRSH
jgi:hypothetical protein